jgi:hypothetical protein
MCNGAGVWHLEQWPALVVCVVAGNEAVHSGVVVQLQWLLLLDFCGLICDAAQSLRHSNNQLR